MEHLNNIQNDMMIWFKDLLELDIPEWIMLPFDRDANGVNIEIQEELVELQSDETARSVYKKMKRNLGELRNW